MGRHLNTNSNSTPEAKAWFLPPCPEPCSSLSSCLLPMAQAITLDVIFDGFLSLPALNLLTGLLASLLTYDLFSAEQLERSTRQVTSLLSSNSSNGSRHTRSQSHSPYNDFPTSAVLCHPSPPCPCCSSHPGLLVHSISQTHSCLRTFAHSVSVSFLSILT